MIFTAGSQNLIKAGAFDFTGLKRKYLLLSYNRLTGSKNIPYCSMGPIPRYEDYPEDFDPEEMLEMEEKILGFCASGSPLQYFKSELEDYPIVISGHFPDLAAGKDIFCAGIIISRKIQKTRDGKNMLLCTMEDEDGMYESVFFSDAYKKNFNTVSSQSAMIIEGRICSKDDHISVIGKNTVSLAGLKKTRSRIKKDTIKNNLLAKAASAWEIREE